MQESFGQGALRSLYSLVLRLALPVSLFYLLWRGLRQRDYFDRWSERFALYQGPGLDSCLWLHAVSVGEVNAVAPLVEALRGKHPHCQFLITTTTPTGSARVRALWGDSVQHVYLPYDLPGAVRNFLEHFQPRLALVVETEIWPNLFHAVAQRKVPLLIVNARISDKSLAAYRPISPLIRQALRSVSLIAAQSIEDAARFRRLGADKASITMPGNLKFDLPIAEDIAKQAHVWRMAWGLRPVWVAASTHPEEESIVLAAHRFVQAVFPEALLLWAPRHPERFAAVAGASERAGFRVGHRRVDVLPNPNTDVFVIDTLGELMAFYAAADVAFVGGSLQKIGGHNLLEPAALGVPALVGPHTFNFQDITALLMAVGAVQRIRDAASLAQTVAGLLADPPDRLQRGSAGQARIALERGAVARTMRLVESFMPAVDQNDGVTQPAPEPSL